MGNIYSIDWVVEAEDVLYKEYEDGELTYRELEQELNDLYERARDEEH